MKLNLNAQWILLLLVTLLPTALLLPAGLWWLWENNLLLAWMLLATVLALAGWFLSRQMQAGRFLPQPLDIQSDTDQTPESSAAWQEVEAVAARLREQAPDLSDRQFYWSTFREVVERVARHYHPDERDPILELHAPHLLRVIELLAQDLRTLLVEHVPGSHLLTVNDVLRGRRLFARGVELYNLYRVISMGFNPISSIIREIRGVATANMVAASRQELESWLVDIYVKKIGFYAIELYSGRLVLDDSALERHATAASQRAIEQISGRDAEVDSEPLRILVLGQVKAGKSSLVNALFGEVKAAVDVLPKTRTITPYLLEKDGIDRALILDSAGYEDAGNPTAPLQAATKEILQCDLILLVCSARSAARAADRNLLDYIRKTFRDTGSNTPPILAVLSHIDQLRPFRQWDPPYNVEQPDNAKAESIRNAMDAVAADLQLALEQVVPVCLQAAREYNIDAGLTPAILQQLDSARRVKYLRCLADYRDAENWRLLWQQSKHAGAFIAKRGLGWLDSAVKKLDEQLRP